MVKNNIGDKVKKEGRLQNTVIGYKLKEQNMFFDVLCLKKMNVWTYTVHSKLCNDVTHIDI